jgi:hypothetical protein
MPNVEPIKTANNVRVPRMYKDDRSAEGHITQQAGWQGNRAGCIQAFSGYSRTHQLALAELTHMACNRVSCMAACCCANNVRICDLVYCNEASSEALLHLLTCVEISLTVDSD